MRKQQLILFTAVGYAPVEYMTTHGFNHNLNNYLSFNNVPCRRLSMRADNTFTRSRALYTPWLSSKSKSKGLSSSWPSSSLYMASIEQGHGDQFIDKRNNQSNNNNNINDSNAKEDTLSDAGADSDNGTDADAIKDKGIDTNQNTMPVTSTDSQTDQSPQQSQSQLQEVYSPYIQTNEKEIVGIGGKGGYTYDVNKLKSNLVQKSIKQFKNELLQLLITPPSSKSTSTSSNMSANKSKAKPMMNNSNNHNLIDEKISALISTNPVSTTTDSNLLDGTWDFAYSTNNAEYILQDSRVVLSNPRRKPQLSLGERSHSIDGDDEFSAAISDNTSPTWRLRPHNEKEGTDSFFKSWSREIYLENLDDDEDPFMVDRTTRWDGLSMTERYFKIVGLSRTSLEVEPVSRTHYIFGRGFNTKLNNNIQKTVGDETILMELQFIYLDSDLCITMSSGSGGINKTGQGAVLYVYTKNDEWRESRKKNKTSLIIGLLSNLFKTESPLRLRKRISSIFNKNGTSNDSLDDNKLTEEEYQILFRRVYADKESKLMALRLGDVGDSSADDETAWEGDEDPFVHLSADERQQIMKQMSIEEITEAGSNHKRLMMKLEKKKGFKRQKKFKRPSFGWEGDRK